MYVKNIHAAHSKSFLQINEHLQPQHIPWKIVTKHSSLFENNRNKQDAAAQLKSGKLARSVFQFQLRKQPLVKRLNAVLNFSIWLHE